MRFIILATGIALLIGGAYFYKPDNPWLCIPGQILIISSFSLPLAVLTSILGLALLVDGYYFFGLNNPWLYGLGGFVIISGIFYSRRFLRDSFVIIFNSTLRHKIPDEFPVNLTEATEVNKSLVDGYALYKQGKFDDAKLCFQNQIDNYRNSSEARIAQVQLHFMSTKPASSNVVMLFGLYVYMVFKQNEYESFERAVEGANYIGYMMIALVTLYWIYYYFRWPNVSEANKNLGSAISWLWFISTMTLLIGALDISSVVNVRSAYGLDGSRGEINDSIIMLLSGLVMAVMAYLTAKAQPFIGMIALFFAAIIYAYDTGYVLSLIALSRYVKLNGTIYISAIIHVMALYSITKAIGACRALDLLVKRT